MHSSKFHCSPYLKHNTTFTWKSTAFSCPLKPSNWGQSQSHNKFQTSVWRVLLSFSLYVQSVTEEWAVGQMKIGFKYLTIQVSNKKIWSFFSVSPLSDRWSLTKISEVPFLLLFFFALIPDSQVEELFCVQDWILMKQHCNSDYSPVPLSSAKLKLSGLLTGI